MIYFRETSQILMLLIINFKEAYTKLILKQISVNYLIPCLLSLLLTSEANRNF